MTARNWIGIAAISLLYTTPAVWGCSCVGPSGLDILSNNAAVFSGKVRTIEYLEPDAHGSEPPIRVTFEVLEVWKGPVRNTAVLSTIHNKFSCDGFYFTEGQTYLIAAETITRDDTESDAAELAGIFLCGGTSLLSDARDDIKEFGEGQRPQ